MKMSTHEDEDQDQDQEINVDSDSRLSCGSNSDVDMDGDGSCYDSETALGWVVFLFCVARPTATMPSARANWFLH